MSWGTPTRNTVGVRGGSCRTYSDARLEEERVPSPARMTDEGDLPFLHRHEGEEAADHLPVEPRTPGPGDHDYTGWRAAIGEYVGIRLQGQRND